MWRRRGYNTKEDITKPATQTADGKVAVVSYVGDTILLKKVSAFTPPLASRRASDHYYHYQYQPTAPRHII